MQSYHILVSECCIRLKQTTHVWSTIPMKIVSRVPHRFHPTRVVARGETSRAIILLSVKVHYMVHETPTQNSPEGSEIKRGTHR